MLITEIILCWTAQHTGQHVSISFVFPCYGYQVTLSLYFTPFLFQCLSKILIHSFFLWSQTITANYCLGMLIIKLSLETYTSCPIFSTVVLSPVIATCTSFKITQPVDFYTIPFMPLWYWMVHNYLCWMQQSDCYMFRWTVTLTTHKLLSLSNKFIILHFPYPVTIQCLVSSCSSSPPPPPQSHKVDQDSTVSIATLSLIMWWMVLGAALPILPPSRAEVKEIVRLYLYSPSGPLWPVLGWTSPFLPFYPQPALKCTEWNIGNNLSHITALEWVEGCKILFMCGPVVFQWPSDHDPTTQNNCHKVYLYTAISGSGHSIQCVQVLMMFVPSTNSCVNSPEKKSMKTQKKFSV
jgi:hypothetical protein